MIYGPWVAATISALDGITVSLRGHSLPAFKHFFNITALFLTSFLSGCLFYLLLGVEAPLSKPDNIPDLYLFFVHTCLTAGVFFSFNSGTVVMAMSLVTGMPFFATLRENLLWSSLATVAGSSVAALAFLNFKETEALSLVIVFPVVLVLHYAYRFNLNRIDAALAHTDQLKDLFHSTISSLAMAIDAKDQYTHGHVNRVQLLVLLIAGKLGIRDSDELEGLRAASLLHDIGKLAIPEYILNKPSGLTRWEIQKMRTHPDVGADILRGVPFPYPVVPYVRHHHERWDGTGYPDGMAGDKIPLGARILSVADCYDALRSDRPYRPAMTQEVALDYIRSLSGKAYDPRLVDILDKHIDEFEEKLGEADVNAPMLQPATIEQLEAPARARTKSLANTVFHDIASAHREIQAVYEISESVGKTLNVSETLALVAAKIKNLVPYDACAIFLIDPHNGKLSPHLTAGDSGSLLEDLTLEMGEGVSGWVAANNQVLPNVSPAPDFLNRPELRDVFKGCVSIPLSLDERVVGVISVYSSSGDNYEDNHLRFLDTLARQAAAAVNNAIVYEETQEDAYTDALTGLPNLRYFRVFGEQELRRAARIDYPVTLLMMDLDSFKRANDQWGHKIGDRTLIEVSHVLRNQLRRSDTCIRYGGDEFVAILPGVAKDLSESSVVRIQQAVETHTILLEGGEALSVGISIGAATFPEDAGDLDSLLGRADQAMYANKMRRAGQAPSSILHFSRRS